MKKISIIGAGNMGSAIAAGLAGRDYSLTVTNRSRAKLEKLSGLQDVTVSTDNVDAVKNVPDLLILAVKPYLIADVLRSVASDIDFEKTAIASLAATVTLADLADILSPYTDSPRLLRVMPNTGVAHGESMTFICSTPDSAGIADQVCGMFRSLGQAAVIDEKLYPAATALCSCGIAYALRYVRAMTEGAVELGFTPGQALEYTVATIEGALSLLHQQGAHPEVEIDRVTTAGGLTIRGLNAMEDNGFTKAVIAALRASV